MVNEERVPVIQQELSYKKEGEKEVINDDKMPVELLKLDKHPELVLKNLGSQMGWAVVFYVEYLGPIVIYALCYLLGNRSNYSTLQQYAIEP